MCVSCLFACILLVIYWYLCYYLCYCWCRIPQLRHISTHTTSYAGGRHNMPPPPASWPLTFWPWKWCPSHVWRELSLPIWFFLGLSVLDLGLMYATDRQTSDVRRASSLNAPYPRGGDIISKHVHCIQVCSVLSDFLTSYASMLYFADVFYLFLCAP